MQTESNPQSPVVGWKPKGEKEAEAISLLLNKICDNDGRILKTASTDRLKYFGILEALCDPVREPEKKEHWEYEENGKGDIYIRSHKASLELVRRNSDETWQELAKRITYQLNRPAPSQPTDREILEKWDELYGNKSSVSHIVELVRYFLSNYAGPKHLEDSEIEKISDELFVGDIGYSKLIKMGKWVRDFYEGK